MTFTLDFPEPSIVNTPDTYLPNYLINTVPPSLGSLLSLQGLPDHGTSPMPAHLKTTTVPFSPSFGMGLYNSYQRWAIILVTIKNVLFNSDMTTHM